MKGIETPLTAAAARLLHMSAAARTDMADGGNGGPGGEAAELAALFTPDAAEKLSKLLKVINHPGGVLPHGVGQAADAVAHALFDHTGQASS